MTEQGAAVAWTHGMADVEPGVRLHYVEAGGGASTIVLLHGFPQTWREWRRVIPELAAAGFRLIAPDHRGAGHSSRPPGGYDKRTMAGDIAAIMASLGHSKYQVVGHDRGARVAHRLTLDHSSTVTRLSVLDLTLPAQSSGVLEQLKAENLKLEIVIRPDALEVGDPRALEVAKVHGIVDVAHGIHLAPGDHHLEGDRKPVFEIVARARGAHGSIHPRSR